MPTSKPTPRKAGRPPLPEGSTKAAMLRIRVTADELRSVGAQAKADGKTRSEFIRSKLLATEGAKACGFQIRAPPNRGSGSARGRNGLQ